MDTPTALRWIVRAGLGDEPDRSPLLGLAGMGGGCFNPDEGWFGYSFMYEMELGPRWSARVGCAGAGAGPGAGAGVGKFEVCAGLGEDRCGGGGGEGAAPAESKSAKGCWAYGFNAEYSGYGGGYGLF